MDLPLLPPVEPMLARLSRTIPEGASYRYEPKWDGFRCLAFRDGDEIELQSRRGRSLARYFPELVAAFARLAAVRWVLDGEVVVPGPRGLDFVALLNRLHPAASRVSLLRAATPASFIAFDLLALGDDDLLSQPFAKRRELLESVFEGAEAPLFVTPITEDIECAREWFDRFSGAGLDGIVAKDVDQPYRPGTRTMIKVKHDYTADCVVAGFRWHHAEPNVGSLLLGVYDHGRLLHIGLASTFTRTRRLELLNEITPFVTDLAGHPWEDGFAREPPGAVARLPGTASRWGEGGVPNWVPLRPELVAEVAYDHLDGGRFRHGVRFRRWRPDRDPRSCSFEQFEHISPTTFDDLIASARGG